MSIDFSKAPEGATHYKRWMGYAAWYRVAAGVPELYDSGRGTWGPSVSEVGELSPIPTFEPFVSVEYAPTTGSKHDPVNNPSHYASGGIECIEAIKASMSREAFLGYLKGNVQKYMWRYEKKANPVEDLKKARWYQERLIAEQE